MIAILRMSIPTVYLFPVTASRQPAGSCSAEARRLGKPLQPDFGPPPDMADDLGGAQATDLAAGGERQPAGQAEQKARGIKIARSGGVDHPRHRLGGDRVGEA